MDKEEYRQKLDELTGYVKQKDFKKALDLADEIDWRRVKSLNTLNMVADIYEVNKDYERAKEILELALSRASIGHSILYRLVEVCLKLGEVDEAEKYFNAFSKTAKNDNSRCILQYKLYKAKKAPLEAQIDVLEEYREREYTERWAYELALLYSKAGDRKKCVDACDDLILWFGEGKYVLRAMELKKKYEPLSPSQEQAYERMKKKYRQPAGGEEEIATEEADASERADSFAVRDEQKAASNSGLTPVTEEKTEPSETKVLPGAESFTRGFRSIFHAPADEKSAQKATQTNSGNIPADESEEAGYEDGLKIRKLEKEDLSTNVTKTAAAGNTRRPISNYEAGKTADFDLNAFLAETAGSFSSEIGGKQFEKNREEPAEEAAESPEEAAVNADVQAHGTTDHTAGVSGSQSEIAQPDSEEENPAAEKTGAEEGGTGATQSQEADSGMTELSGAVNAGQDSAAAGDAAKAAGAAASAATDNSETAGSAAAGDTPVVASSAAAAIAGLAAGSTKASEAKASAEENHKDQSDTAAAAAAQRAGAEAADTEAGADTQAETGGQEMASEGNSAAQEAEQQKPAEEAPAKPEKKKPHYIEELEIPDPEPTEEEKKNRTHTITLNTIGENTVPISIDKILSEETPEERRIRILNKAKPTRMSEDQRKIFTYFARVPGMDGQILEAINGVYQHAGERTSLHGNIAIMGARGTGKSRLAQGLVVAMCKDLGLDAAKVARITGKEMNKRDPAKVVSLMAGGFLMIEDISDINEETLEQLNQAMEFRTDCMILIIEDEKTRMRAFLKEHPQFAAKFEKVISIPVFTNDELVTFARTYATENGCKIDDMAILALYTMIGNIQSEEEPTTISTVKKIIDNAILRATKGRRKKGRSDAEKTGKWLILHEKDFALN